MARIENYDRMTVNQLCIDHTLHNNQIYNYANGAEPCVLYIPICCCCHLCQSWSNCKECDTGQYISHSTVILDFLLIFI